MSLGTTLYFSSHKKKHSLKLLRRDSPRIFPQFTQRSNKFKLNLFLAQDFFNVETKVCRSLPLKTPWKKGS